MQKADAGGQTAGGGSMRSSVGAFSVATVVSRILGLAREMVFAHVFGAGLAMDAFVVAFRIPNLLRDIFAEGVMSAAFVNDINSLNLLRKNPLNKVSSHTPALQTDTYISRGSGAFSSSSRASRTSCQTIRHGSS